MQKTVTYNKIDKFVVKHIRTRIEYTTTESPFMLPQAQKVLAQYVRFIYAGLGLRIKPAKRVSVYKCLDYLLWLKHSVNLFARANPQYKIGEKATPNWVSNESVLDKLFMFQGWFVEEFQYETGIYA